VIVHLTGPQLETLRRLGDAAALPYGEVVLDLLERHWVALEAVWQARERAHGLPAPESR